MSVTFTPFASFITAIFVCYVHHCKHEKLKKDWDILSIFEKYHEEISCDMNFCDAGWEI
jgi:hypothetical protein